PACGTLHAFPGSWPWSPPNFTHPQSFLYVNLFPRNCLPSLHTAWALLIWRQWQLNKGYFPRMLISLWLIFLLISTITCGGHYLIDVIVGFAFAVMVQGICDSSMHSNRRLQAIFGGAIMCLSWLFLIGFGISW